MNDQPSMKRIFIGVVLAAAMAGTAATAPLFGQTLSDISALLREVPEPTLNTLPTVYQTQLSLETLPEPAVVTDDELLAAGTTQLLVLPALSAADFVVDDDLAQCPDANFTTSTGIQQAVAAAPPGSVIRVCPGVYDPTIINKTLRLEAPRQHGQAVQCQADLVPDPEKDAIVDAKGTPAIGLNVQADGVVLYGFTVRNTANNPGIYTSPVFSGYALLFNIVQENTIGLYLNSSGVIPTTVERNCFRFNNRPGAAGGSGIYSDQGLRNAGIRENVFTGQPSAAMIFTLNVADIVVEHNDMIDDAGTIVLVDTHNARVAYNHSVDITSSGIFVGGGVTDTEIVYNLLENPGGTGITTNVQFVSAANTGLIIEKNHIRNSAFDGIRLNQTDQSFVRGNKSERNVRDGIRLQNDSDFNAVSDNLSRDNGRDGMRVDGGVQSGGNTIERNKMLGNVEHDCHDDTLGAGTSGTANLWLGNVGKTENRAGLCKSGSTP